MINYKKKYLKYKSKYLQLKSFIKNQHISKINNLKYNDFFINKIIKYWFNNNYTTFNETKWFKNGKEYDNEIIIKFKSILKKAEKKQLLHWYKTKNGFLAHTILLDQFSRHIYRNTADAYKNDKMCLEFVDKYLLCYLDRLKPIESLFALMPYQHSENLCKQKTGLFFINYLLSKEKTKFGIKILKIALKHQKAHYKVIKEFGRFPKRNIFLSRKSNKKEINYIKNSNKYLPY